MVIFVFSMLSVFALFFCGEVVGRVWKDIHEYEVMRSRGYKLLENDKGEFYWVGYDD